MTSQPRSSGPSRPPGRPRDEQVDAAILAATRELLVEVGYERLTMTDVAARAEVGRPTVYRRYASKEALVAASVDAVRQPSPAPDTGSLRGDLRAELLPRAAELGEPLLLQFLAVLLVSNAEGSPFAQVYWRKAVAARRAAFGEMLERAQLRGELADDLDVDLLTDLVGGGMIYQALRPAGVRDEPLAQRVERVVELVCRLLTGVRVDGPGS